MSQARKCFGASGLSLLLDSWALDLKMLALFVWGSKKERNMVMNKICSVSVFFTLLFLSFFCFAQNIEEDTLSAEYKAGYDYSLRGGIENIVYVPKDWGTLKGVTAHGGMDILYFEASDGSIYVIQGAPEQCGKYFFKKGRIAKILRK